eukprot:4093894-Pyramimonas_sp.AAC.1
MQQKPDPGEPTQPKIVRLVNGKLSELARMYDHMLLNARERGRSWDPVFAKCEDEQSCADLRTLIVQLVLEMRADFERRLLGPLTGYPYRLLRLLRAPGHVADVEGPDSRASVAQD